MCIVSQEKDKTTLVAPNLMFLLPGARCHKRALRFRGPNDSKIEDFNDGFGFPSPYDDSWEKEISDAQNTMKKGAKNAKGTGLAAHPESLRSEAPMHPSKVRAESFTVQCRRHECKLLDHMGGVYNTHQRHQAAVCRSDERHSVCCRERPNSVSGTRQTFHPSG